jgi:hypothetical protein
MTEKKHDTECYSVECRENSVLIHGYLTIDDAFDLLHYFRKRGFTCLTPGDENSALYLTKIDFTKN